MADAVGDRPIDALIISAGGNDAGFAPVGQVCLLKGDCPHAPVSSADNSGSISLQTRVSDGLAALPGQYDQLAACIQPTGQPCVLDLMNEDGQVSQVPVSSLGANPAHVYLTEYPDGTRQDNGETCDAILNDVIGLPGFLIDRQELQWAVGAVAGASSPTHGSGVNGVLSGAAEKFGWNLANGVSSQFAGPGYGHGYCAQNHWIRRAADSAYLQGPLSPDPNAPGYITVGWLGTRATTTGTLHPTAEGYQAYSKALVPRLKAGLYDSGSEPAQGPTYDSSNTDGTTHSDEGTNDWLIGRCPSSGSCVSDYAVLTVATSDPSGILGASLAIEGTPGCTTAGVTCTSAALVDSQTYRWSFAMTEGMHRLDFSVRRVDGQVATFSREVKVDLTAPTASTTVAPASPANAGWYRTPVTVTFQGTDNASGSGVAGIDYWLNGAISPARLGVGETLEMKTDGTHTIQYQAVDWAGRKSAMQTLTLKIDQTAPTFTCGAADGLWHASDVSLGCNASDSGSSLANAADATFSLTTGVAQGTKTASAETSARSVCDVAGNCSQAGPIGGNKIDKKNPVVVITTPAQGAVYFLGASVAADYTCSDGGSGVASCAGTASNGNPIDTASIGVKTFSVTTTDGVGNTTAVSLTYEVHYDFRGFFAPVDNKDASGNFILNTVKAGSAVPVKFSLGGNQGLKILAPGAATSPNPKSEAVSCTTSGTEDVVEETVNAGGSSLSYDASANQYTYVWKTDKAWATTCRLFTLTLSDGTLHQAKFKFTK